MEDNVKIVKIGTVSSGEELANVIGSAKGNLVAEAMDCLTSIAAIEKSGFVGERKRWREAPSDSTVKIFGADAEPAYGKTTIWAAIVVGADDQSVILLKVVDTYAGGDQESEGLLGDALYRKEKGQVS
jgi:hypothetical protein